MSRAPCGRRSMPLSGRSSRNSAPQMRPLSGSPRTWGNTPTSCRFRDAFPTRFLNVGMAEQNLIAIAAGLARTGHIPFATTYGVFATRARVRLCCDRLCSLRPQCEDHCGTAGTDNRLRWHASGDRRYGTDVYDSGARSDRSVRRHRNHGSDPRYRRLRGAPFNNEGSCGARFPLSWTSRTRSRSARRGC